MTLNNPPPSDPPPVFVRTPEGWRFSVRLAPGASRNELGGLFTDAQGRVMIRAQVTAIPENGKANDALVKLLSKSWRIPKSALRLIGGHTDRIKVFVLDAQTPPALK